MLWFEWNTTLKLQQIYKQQYSSLSDHSLFIVLSFCELPGTDMKIIATASNLNLGQGNIFHTRVSFCSRGGGIGFQACTGRERGLAYQHALGRGRGLAYQHALGRGSRVGFPACTGENGRYVSYWSAFLF